jgi:hypothetical protein
MEKHTLELTRGDHYSKRIRWLDADGQPIPIASARLQARRDPDASAKMLALDETDGLELAEPGTIDIAITPAHSSGITGDGVWDLEVTSAAGKTKTLLGGKLRGTKDVSR